jgi:hypothetical protein
VFPASYFLECTHGSFVCEGTEGAKKSSRDYKAVDISTKSNVTCSYEANGRVVGRRDIIALALLVLQVSHSIVVGAFSTFAPITDCGRCSILSELGWPRRRCQVKGEATSTGRGWANRVVKAE